MATEDFEKYLASAQAVVANSVSQSTLSQVKDVCEKYLLKYLQNHNFQYQRAWKSWQSFCTTHNISELEAEEKHLLAYLGFVAETCRYIIYASTAS